MNSDLVFSTVGLDSVSSRFKKVGNLFVSAIFDGISHNGKSIAEVREKEEPAVQVRPNEAIAFFVELN